MQRAGYPLLLLCGAPAAGKSSVAWEIYYTLVRAAVPVAHVDLDGLGYGPPDQFGSFALKFENLGAVWRSYARAGATAVVVSGLRTLRADIEAAIGAVPESIPTVVVLTVTAEEQRERIVTRAHARYALERGGGSSSQTPAALEQFVAAAAQQLDYDVQDVPSALVVDTVGATVPDLTRQVLAATRWPFGSGERQEVV